LISKTSAGRENEMKTSDDRFPAFVDRNKMKASFQQNGHASHQEFHQKRIQNRSYLTSIKNE